MTCFTDPYGRVIAQIKPQPGDELAVLAPPIFNVDADQLMNVLAEGGIEWFVMNSGTASLLFLAFELQHGVTLDALDAAQRLKRRFDADADLRQQMTDYALSIGQAFHEFGAAGTVWRTPDDNLKA